MTNTLTTDTEASARQVMRIADAGAELVRLTTQGVREAMNMANIKNLVKEHNYHVPLVADVHFNPKAAYAAAKTCDKVRINPGNFVDAARTFKKLEYTDEEYQREIEKIRDALKPFIDICKERGVCVRLGVNHGSLSDRIMSRYGDTPEGMVESVMEYLRICRELDFDNIVISIKASNVVVMTRTVRMLVIAMDAEDMHFPIHLGVTEAGDGEDGRVKSAVGIGALLAEGLGDTIRVSLSETPEAEISPAMKLRDYIAKRESHPEIVEPRERTAESRAESVPVAGFEQVAWPLVAGLDFYDADMKQWHRADAAQSPVLYDDLLPIILTSHHINAPGEMASWIDRFVEAGGKNPIILSLRYEDEDLEDIQIKAGADLGFLLLNGYGRGVELQLSDKAKEKFGADTAQRIALGILQAARLRISKTEYIACPGCGRTLFDLPSTLREVKEVTSMFKTLKIGVMGCIVNGPGEMADADYGYVGAGPGRVSIYKGKQLIEKNIPTSDALYKLLDIIRQDHPE